MSAQPKLPEMITADEIAADLKQTPRYFKEKFSRQPGFPVAIKIGANREWILSEYVAWKLKQREC